MKLQICQNIHIYQGDDMTISVETSKPISIDSTKNEVQNKAAIVIQSAWRGYIVRKHVKEDFLSFELFKKTLEYIEVNYFRYLPRRYGGSLTAYFLPQDIPVVIKEFGGSILEYNESRYEIMMKARQICRMLHTKHLVIPPARLYKSLLFESKLTVTTDQVFQYGLYVENRDRFTLPVLEFLRFIFVTGLSDIVGYDYSKLYPSLSQTFVGTYRNVSPYMDNGRIRISLVDLGQCDDIYLHCDDMSASSSIGYHGIRYISDNIFSRCCDAICLFPYHYDEIIQEANKWSSFTETYYSHLNKLREESIQRIKFIYLDHVAFLEKKGISCENPTIFDSLSLDRKEQIKQKIKERFSLKDTLRTYGELIFPFIDIVIPRMVDAIILEIQSYFQNKLIESVQPTTKSELIKFRYVEIKYSNLLNTILPSLSEDESFVKFTKNHIHSGSQWIFKELVKGGEIYGYSADNLVYC
jgi:hypothetical protein